jgi:hypothetical protein
MLLLLSTALSPVSDASLGSGALVALVGNRRADTEVTSWCCEGARAGCGVQLFTSEGCAGVRKTKSGTFFESKMVIFTFIESFLPAHVFTLYSNS